MRIYSATELDHVRDDVRAVLAAAPAEAPGLLLAIQEGRVDGSTYIGECACLIGTIANLRGCGHYGLPGLEPNQFRPAETFFLSIRRGDKPFTSRASALAEEWVKEFIAEQQSTKEAL